MVLFMLCIVYHNLKEDLNLKNQQFVKAQVKLQTFLAILTLSHLTTLTSGISLNEPLNFVLNNVI